MKKIINFLCLLLTILTVNGCYESKNGWELNGNIWRYYNNGRLTTNEWISYDGDWYYMDSIGAMATNEWIDNYYVGNDGKMLKNTVTPDGYYVGADGIAPNKEDSLKEKLAKKFKLHKTKIGSNEHIQFYYYNSFTKLDDITEDIFRDGLITRRIRYGGSEGAVQVGWSDIRGQERIDSLEKAKLKFLIPLTTLEIVDGVKEIYDTKYEIKNNAYIMSFCFMLKGFKTYCKYICYNNKLFTCLACSSNQEKLFDDADAKYIIDNIEFVYN